MKQIIMTLVRGASMRHTLTQYGNNIFNDIHVIHRKSSSSIEEEGEKKKKRAIF